MKEEKKTKNEITVTFTIEVIKIVPVSSDDRDDAEVQLRGEDYKALLKDKAMNAFCADNVAVRDLKVFVSNKAVSDECVRGTDNDD